MSERDFEEGPDVVFFDGTPEALDDIAPLVAYEALRGGLVVVPTDTVYALAGRAFDEFAVKAIYDVKRRPADRKLPLLVAEPSDLGVYAPDAGECAATLAADHWPGGLTIVVPAGHTIPEWLADERGAVALRCPDHELVRTVVRSLKEPLAATSLNFSGTPAATSISEIPTEILESIDLVVDGGPSGALVSTVVDCTTERPVVLRQGAIDLKL